MDDNSKKMALTPKNFMLLIAGLVVMIIGYILMTGGGSDDPQVFNEAMFDFRSLVAAPVVIMLGVVVEIVAIMGWARFDRKDKDSKNQ